MFRFRSFARRNLCMASDRTPNIDGIATKPVKESGLMSIFELELKENKK